MPNGQQKEIKVTVPEKLAGGAYTNNMLVSHTKEEFVMDFMMMAPQAGVVTARVIASPGHMKRIVAALQDNIQKYEQAFGEIKPAEAQRGRVVQA